MPTINPELLAGAAKELGKYIMEAEWDCLLEGVSMRYEERPEFEEFVQFARGYMYYNALVCACDGDEEAIESALRSDLEEIGKDLDLW